MANEVKLVFAGDATSLTKTFTQVGSDATTMAGKVGGSSRDIGGAIDGSEAKFRGLGDVVGGTGDIMDGFKEGNVAGVAMGFADLAGGISTLVIPALGAIKGALLTGLAPALTAISAHPLVAALLIGGVIIGGLILLEKKFGVVTTAIGFVKDAATTTFDFLAGLFLNFTPLGILIDNFEALVGVIDGVIEGFKRLWNSSIGGKGFSFGGVDLPGPFDIPSFSFKIPTLHQGGVVPGLPGQESLALLTAGERVTPAGGGPQTIVVNVSGVGMGRDFGQAVAQALRDNQLIGVT